MILKRLLYEIAGKLSHLIFTQAVGYSYFQVKRLHNVALICTKAGKSQ